MSLRVSASQSPSNGPKISVVVPLFNEEDCVEPLQKQLAEALADWDYEIVLVDDGSTDETAARVQRSDRVRLLRLQENTGQSAAMYAGIHAARGEIIAMMDGDLQNDPADIPKLAAEVESGVDLCCGYRAKRKDSAFKRFQSRIANFVRKRFTGDGVRDTGCSLKAMKRECRDALIPFRGMHRFIPALIKAGGYEIAEVAVNHRPREHGESKYGGGLKRAIPATRDMFGVNWLNSRKIAIKLTEDSDV